MGEISADRNRGARSMSHVVTRRSCAERTSHQDAPVSRPLFQSSSGLYLLFIAQMTLCSEADHSSAYESLAAACGSPVACVAEVEV